MWHLQMHENFSSSMLVMNMLIMMESFLTIYLGLNFGSNVYSDALGLCGFCFGTVAERCVTAIQQPEGCV